MPVDEAAPADATCAQYEASLRGELGSALVESTVQRNDLYVRVHRDAWADTAAACRRKFGLDYFCFLSGLDWLDSPAQTTRYENVWGSVDADDTATEPSEAAEAPAAAAALRTGLAGGASRFQVFARFASLRTHRGIVVKADLDDTDPRVASIVRVFAGANWHERETWEMFGFWFDGHPGLTHIYLPGAFEGYPLRKDFPLLAREVKPWPGLTNVEPIAGESDDEAADA